MKNLKNLLRSAAAVLFVLGAMPRVFAQSTPSQDAYINTATPHTNSYTADFVVSAHLGGPASTPVFCEFVALDDKLQHRCEWRRQRVRKNPVLDAVIAELGNKKAIAPEHKECCDKNVIVPCSEWVRIDQKPSEVGSGKRLKNQIE